MKISETGIRVASQNNRYATCYCPFHDDKHASALVYLDNLWFVCFVCHISKPFVEAARDAGLDATLIAAADNIQDFDLMGDGYKFNHLTIEGQKYLEERGIVGDLPNYVISPMSNSGVGFAFQKHNGEVIGAQVRLFPHNVKSKSVRFVFEGKRLPYFGNIQAHYQKGHKLFVFEKAFATLKAQQAVDKYNLPIAPISAVGSHFQGGLTEIVNVNSTAFFDNDVAGINAARKMKKMTGARVIIAARPLDELTIEEMRVYLERYL